MSVNGLSAAQQAAAVTPLRPPRAKDPLVLHAPAASSSSLRPGSGTTAPSASAGPPTAASPIGPPRAPLALDTLLEAHAGAPSPARAALEAAVADRNTVAAENTALWQRLARMRDELADAKRDRDRYRAERDAFRGRLHQIGEPTDGLRPRKLRASPSGPVAAAAAQSASGRDSPSTNGRLAAVRQHPDDGRPAIAAPCAPR
jgi:hypothetical protein